MSDTASDLARRLARNAEAVCRHYLSNGQREGRYWLVGDVANTPGRSLFVRLRGPDFGKGAAGKWTDAAEGRYGDLLDLIAANQHLNALHDTLDEARRFLSLPRPPSRHRPQPPASPGSRQAARRLFAMSKPLRGTVAEAYLRTRAITAHQNDTSLRFHPSCFYRPDRDDAPDVQRAWPALIAAVTDLNGRVAGVHRTWLDPLGMGKAAVITPRRAMGELLGHGVRFGVVHDLMTAGEGLETMLSLRSILFDLPVVAALSAAHLAALQLPPTLRRLYIAHDADAAGRRAADQLGARAEAAGIEALRLTPALGDFNEDLVKLGAAELRANLRVQLAPEDVVRLMPNTLTQAEAG